MAAVTCAVIFSIKSIMMLFRHEQVFTHNNNIIIAWDLLRIDVQGFTELCSFSLKE